MIEPIRVEMQIDNDLNWRKWKYYLLLKDALGLRDEFLIMGHIYHSDILESIKTIPEEDQNKINAYLWGVK